METDRTALTLAGTTKEARAGLLRFGYAAAYDCSARHGDVWTDPVCGKPARWYVGLEDAHAGMTADGYFNPATTYTNLCDGHLAEVQGEPRRVFSVERRVGGVEQLRLNLIQRYGLPQKIGCS